MNGAPGSDALSEAAACSQDPEPTESQSKNGRVIEPGDPIALARILKRSPDEAQLRTMSLDDLASSPTPLLALLRGGGYVAVVESGGERHIVDKNGRPAPLDDPTFRGLFADAALVFHPPTEAATSAPSAANPTANAAEFDADQFTSTSLSAFVFGQLVTKRKWLFLQLLAAATLSNAFAFALPIFTMIVYDRVIPHGAQSTLIALSIGIVIVLVLDLILKMARARFVEAIALETGNQLLEVAFAKTTRAKMVDAPRSSATTAAAMQATETLCQIAPIVLIGLMVDLPFAFLMIAYIAYIGGPVAFAPIAAVLMIAAVTLIGHLISRRASKQSAGLGAQRINFLTQIIESPETVKLSRATGQVDRTWRALTDAAAFESHRIRLTSAHVASASAAILQAATVAVLVIGALQIQSGLMTMGALVASTILIGRMLSPVAQLVGSVARMAQLMDSAKPLDQLLSSTPEQSADPEATATHRFVGAMRFNAVTFTYPGAAEPSLCELSFSIPAGQRVAFVGRSGSGKSTIARLSARLYDPDSGSVVIDDYNAAHFEPDSLRGAVSVMNQDSALFDDTLRENILLGQSETTRAEHFKQVVEITGVAKLAAKLDGGFAFKLGPNGDRLSGGERQIVALARALMTDARIVILDEPTSSLDAQIEAHFISHLPHLLRGRTLLLATHRTPALALVDRIIWLDEGRIVADGPRDEIVARLSRGSRM